MDWQIADKDDDPFWYKDAIIYQLHVKAFYDHDNNGIGDFAGLTQKLDYIQDLGVNTIWLLPFYPSPQRDDGYDISDYRNIHPDYGTRKDFRNFLREAHRRGLRVITELVINHTSDQHPWFRAAREAPTGSKKRDFYIWSQSSQKFPETRIIFTDTESSNWTWDDAAQAFYWHRFFHHQPDLNHNNPNVVKAVIRVMNFWLDMGVDGLRLDAVPYLCVREGTNNENLPETHAVLKHMRSVVDARYRNRLFLAEANQWPEDVQDYFGQGDECHMAYHFPLMPRMYMAVALEDRHPIVEIMQQTPEIPDSCQWAIFLRNHDELTLEMVTDRERDYMYERYAADPRMRVNVGIRRRLAPLMDNDIDKIKLMNSLLMSMPGSPIVYYGDEIGMGDNFFLGDRHGVRTPMQWSPDRNAGFSKADPQFLYLPPIMDPIYGYEAVNVEAQNREPSSLLNWMKRIIAARQSYPTFGRGTLEFLNPGNRKILAYIREYGDESILCVANLSRSAQPVELDLSRFKGKIPIELLGRTAFPPIGDLPYMLTLPGHQFYWFCLTANTEAPVWHSEAPLPLKLPVMVLFDGLRSFLSEQTELRKSTMAEKLRTQLEREILPDFLTNQRWFAAKTESLDRIEIVRLTTRSQESHAWLWLWVKVYFAQQEAQIYFLPLSIIWGEADDDHIRPLLHVALARARQRARVGIIYDAVHDEAFVRAIISSMSQSAATETGSEMIHFRATTVFDKFVDDSCMAEDQRSLSESTNSTIALGDRLFLKLYRQLQPGVNLEMEMGRFLTDVSPYPNISPLIGSVEFQEPDVPATTLVLIQTYKSNQGDGWSYTIDYLRRFFEDCLTNPAVIEETENWHADYKWLIHILGLRTGELHRALAFSSGNPDFEPEPILPSDLINWREQVCQDLHKTLEKLMLHSSAISENDQAGVHALLDKSSQLLQRIDMLIPTNLNAVKTRYHGDFHLGQVLLTENDFVIIDFEGEPARPLETRRAKHSPLRDVAGMLRSFSYAGAVALIGCASVRPADRERLMPYVQEWELAARDAFLSGYREGIADCPAWPSADEDAGRLIELFILEKALYELRYELDHRVEWAGVPLTGLLAILHTTSNASGEGA
ncbi:maltose alpha-D-glucosyltransferase [Nitrosomonas marina]|uniref:Maltokinase n=1 Tax=Nitrosomonas marina TaxID=917 RepID=A0A1H8BCA6_9PROT|nr:maltose alpha-D-glucosyltransferase [Nitrosomonas marina]SEM80515.1 maltose alpha-D-glucosyltransferase/ alpha-amylase [Nitrosomonas marina]